MDFWLRHALARAASGRSRSQRPSSAWALPSRPANLPSAPRSAQVIPFPAARIVRSPDVVNQIAARAEVRLRWMQQRQLPIRLGGMLLHPSAVSVASLRRALRAPAARLLLARLAASSPLGIAINLALEVGLLAAWRDGTPGASTEGAVGVRSAPVGFGLVAVARSSGSFPYGPVDEAGRWSSVPLSGAPLAAVENGTNLQVPNGAWPTPGPAVGTTIRHVITGPLQSSGTRMGLRLGYNLLPGFSAVVPAGGLRTMPGKAPRILPAAPPLVHPLPSPLSAPRAVPTPYEALAPSSAVTPANAPPYTRPGARNAPRSGHRFKRPAPRTKERKATIRSMGALSAILRVAEHVTEGVDLVEALYEALPKRRLRQVYADLGRQPRAHEKAMILVRHWNELNIPLAIYNVARNQVQDRAIAAINRPLKTVNQATGQVTGAPGALRKTADPSGDWFGASEQWLLAQLERQFAMEQGALTKGGLERNLRRGEN